MSAAKRGDLAALVRTVTTTGADFTRTTTEQVSLARVTSVTRDGIVKRAEGPWETYRSDFDRARPLIIPASTIDVDAALTAYSQRRYPTAPHSTMVPPFESLAEARDFLRPFRITPDAATVRDSLDRARAIAEDPNEDPMRKAHAEYMLRRHGKA